MLKSQTMLAHFVQVKKFYIIRRNGIFFMIFPFGFGVVLCHRQTNAKNVQFFSEKR